MPTKIDNLTPWLAEAANITSGERRRDYGRPLVNFLRIAIRWSNLLGIYITPPMVALMMVDMKIAREQNTHKDDNWIDILGYAATVSDMDQEMREMGFDGYKQFSYWSSVADLQNLYNRLMNAPIEKERA